MRLIRLDSLRVVNKWGIKKIIKEILKLKKFISFVLSIGIYFNFAGLVSFAETAKVTSECEICRDRCVLTRECKAVAGVDNISAGELTLLRPTLDDFHELKKYYKNVNIRYYLEATDREMTEVQAFFELIRYNEGTNFTFVMKNKGGNLVGAVILTCLSDYVNVAYWVIPEFRGHSYAAKACEALIREVHKKDPSIVFFLKLNAENIPSKNVVKKLKSALIDTCENKKAIELNEPHYEIEETDPINFEYKLLPEDEDNFWLYILKNGRQTYLGLCCREQLLKFTYKKIFDSNVFKFTQLGNFIRFVK